MTNVPVKDQSSAFLWKDIKLSFLGHCLNKSNKECSTVVKPVFHLSIDWKVGKACKPGEILPTKTMPQLMNTHCCLVQWILAYSLYLGVFEEDAAICAIIFNKSHTEMARNTKLRIRKEWQDLPVLLGDHSRQWTGSNHHTQHYQVKLVPMTYVNGTSALKSIADHLGWDTLHFYNF